MQRRNKESAGGEDFLGPLDELVAAAGELMVGTEQREHEHTCLGARPTQDIVPCLVL